LTPHYITHLKTPVLEKFTLRYTISDTISKLLPSKVKLKLFVGNRPPAKIATFVLLELTISFQNFSRTGSYLNTEKRNIDKTYKAMYAVSLHNLSIKCQYDLFDKIVKPIISYQQK
jgi:hypothetical protein